MEGSKLVIDGKQYSINELDKLPKKLSPFEVSTKSDEDTIGFFGELCPFSNFYPAKFNHNGTVYHSGEQLIQHQKALHCNDKEAADHILTTQTAIACKQFSYTIENYDHQGWLDVAREKCREGLRAKFVQNPHLLHTLLSTGNKLLVESSKDNIWGTGAPGRVSAPRVVSAPEGGVCSWGGRVPPPGGSLSQHALRQTLPKNRIKETCKT